MNKNRMMAGALAVTMFAGSVGMAGANVYAKDASEKQKEEVIYIMTDADGNVENVNAVNIFGKGNVTDYGDYSSVKMLNTTDKINQNGDKITFSSDKEKVYYQGTMKDAEIPWNITFTYKLDGKEIAPEDLAGKLGALEIHIKINKNEDCTSDFYDNCALQTTLTLDTGKCENIKADGATLANVGADKQISYTVLPGKGLDATVTADVTDFEMDAATINGVRMDLNVDIDDAELMDKVTQIMDAARELNDGAGTLSEGTKTLADGGKTLADGASSMSDGASSLDSGISTLNSGVNEMQTVLNTLDGNSAELTNGSTAIKQGISDTYAGAEQLQFSISYDAYKAAMQANGLDVDQLQAGNTEAINTLSAQVTEVTTSIGQLQSMPDYAENPTYQAQVAQMQAQIESLSNVMTLLGGNNAALNGTSQYLAAVSDGAANLTAGIGTLSSNYETFDQGIQSYTGGVSSATSAYGQIVSGTNALASGSKELTAGASSLQSGSSELYQGILSLSDGAVTLKDGTEEFYEQTDGMDSKIEDTMDEMLDSITGGDSETTSFVSSKNGKVDSVQFVIKTSAIEKPEAAKKETTEETKTSLGEKFLNLFK